MPTTSSEKYPHKVELHRWDDVFGEWDHEATFRLFWRAEIAAKALTEDSRNTYKLVDTRVDTGNGPTTLYFKDGREIPQKNVEAAA